MTRERYACVSNERWTREVHSSDGSKNYRVSYEQVFVRGRDELVWRFTCECKGYLVHRRTCKHIKSVMPQYCGWQENDWEAPMEYYDEASGEGLCPLCGSSAAPISTMKNLHERVDTTEES